ncbi:MAG: M20/M25/M40 family metallo-hydrolase [Deltaproteobacteria bacterium]|nr:M20/M25/M40 family metallo-hydrolase [Deltaproteobacteria bacterium]
MDLLTTLETLCRPVAPPGREDEMRAALSELLAPVADRLETDRMGNLRAWLAPAGGGPAPRLMLDAHMDEVAFIVQRVEPTGFLRSAPLGGAEARVMPGSRLILAPRPGVHVPAVAGLAPPHVETAADREKALPWDKLYLDAGFPDAAAAAAAGVEIGTPGVVDAGQGPLGQGFFQARNLDDRAGCAALVQAFHGLAAARPAVEVVANFAVAEEVGLRGATTAAFDLAPDLALVVEATVGDTPGVEDARQPSRLGQGPAVTVADGRIIVPWRLVESLEEAARAAGVACQRKLPPYGGTDGGAIHLSRGGVPTAILSVPCRYIHSPVSLCQLTDLAALCQVVETWVRRAHELV